MVIRWLRVGLTVAALSLVGCRTTQPWQREDLARRSMRPDGDGDRRALRDHMTGTREGAVGGLGSGGGGCGCH